ncbi:hypothetical protein VP1G_06357 [Cytospora mali]|uniref:Suppressor protein SRP40 n=1 Tax=Cytospora mali TaxID=578113 RepID=A0A194V541_CYTMA|nr:hypothetical protein VP1G_06357 [Valsa mali var. pyri (nom. inval.)]
MTNKSGSEISQPATAPAEEHYTRLHISPLDPQLLTVIVPQAVLSKARDISYHTIQTFPDKPYGFIELPTAAAEKIKNKLNGAVLKGHKIRIEPARPDDMPKPSDDAVAGAEPERKSKKSKMSKKDKKRKRDPNEIVGVELEEGRKVKRGWTLTPEEAKLKKRKEKEREKKEKKSSKDKKEKTKKKKREPESEYTEGPECLVKTRLPPNKRDVVEGRADGGDDDGSEKKKSRKHKHQVVVHEFEKNSKFPTFFKASTTTSTSNAPSEFVEGKGWVDDKGEVVEEVKNTRPLALPKTRSEKKKPAAVIEDDTTSSSGSSEDEEEDDEEDDGEDEEEQSGVDADADAEKPAMSAPEYGLDLPTAPTSAGKDLQSESASPRPTSSGSGSAKNLTIRIPPATPSSTKVHPLEALYKKQQEEAKADSKTADAEPFSFFGGGDMEDEEDIGMDVIGNKEVGENSPVDRSESIQLPMTPYSKQDFESRGLRSAAPTPDTAHPSRFSRIWPRGERDGPSDVEEEGNIDGITSSKEDGSGDEAGASSTNPNTEFQKWFWEHRGDLNRSWKKRRKMAAKEKRYRENRARADRAI